MAMLLIPGGPFDDQILKPEDRAFIKEREVFIRETSKRAAEDIVKIGQWLTEVRERLPHGSWLPWLTTEFGWSQQSASNFMRVYERFKLLKFSNLAIDISALYLIAARSTPADVAANLLERATEGEHVTHAKAREAIVVSRTTPITRAPGEIYNQFVESEKIKCAEREIASKEEKLLQKLAVKLIRTGYKSLAMQVGGSEEKMRNLKTIKTRLEASLLGWPWY